MKPVNFTIGNETPPIRIAFGLAQQADLALPPKRDYGPFDLECELRSRNMAVAILARLMHDIWDAGVSDYGCGDTAQWRCLARAKAHSAKVADDLFRKYVGG